MRKRSFVELAVEVDVDALNAEIDALPDTAWQSSWWGSPHPSVALVLLRGGRSGTPDDVLCEEVFDQRVLASLPATAALIGPSGPFGGCQYAFLFRMAPGGVALAHADGAAVWHDLHRVHVPLRTHPDAALVVEGRCLHLAPGRAWTFDNQAIHGFVNGPVERTHLILDAPASPRLDALLAAGIVHEGRFDAEVAGVTLARDRAVPSYPGDAVIAAWLRQSRASGWTDGALVEWLTTQRIPARTPGTAWSIEALGRIP